MKVRSIPNKEEAKCDLGLSLVNQEFASAMVAMSAKIY
jgi:hypothetical protein